MKKVTGMLLAAILLSFLSGCFAEHHGDDLTALIARINESLGTNVLNAEGFVLCGETQNAYCFITCADGKELLISVDYDEKNRLTACHAVFEGEASETVKQFIPIYFAAFTQESTDKAIAALGELSAFSVGAELNELVYETENYTFTRTAADNETVLSCEKISTAATRSASTQTHSASEAP